MKKYLFILGLVGTALFTACSTADDLISEKPIETPPDDQPSITTIIAEASQDSEEPITLGIGQSRGYTRAPINPSDVVEGYGNFETESNRYLGVFCLATGTQSGVDNIPSVISDNKWNTTGDDGELIVWLRNVPAKVVTTEVSPGVKTCDVKFVDPGNLSNEKSYFYPMGNWMKYNFYAYYPRQDETVEVSGQQKTTLSFMQSQVLEKYYEIDGSQDIIWGMSDQAHATPVAASKADPYSANYFRKAKAKIAEEGVGNISDYYPKFSFQHKLVQFRFFVKAADATALTTLQNSSAKVTDMYIANAIYKLSLTVAKKTDTEDNWNGKLSMLGDFTTKNLRIKTNGANTDRFDQESPFVDDEDNDDDDLNVDNPFPISASTVDVDAVDGNGNPTDPSFVGYIMLPRPEVYANDFRYQLNMKLEVGGRSNLFTINLDLPSNEDEFEEGKIYNVIVNVQSAEEIFANAELKSWVTYTYDDGGGEKNYIEYDFE